MFNNDNFFLGFLVLTFSGIWITKNLSLIKWKKTVYDIYKHFVVLSFALTILLQIIYLMYSSKTIEDFNESLLLVILIIRFYLQMLFFVLNKQGILKLLKFSCNKLFAPINEQETSVYEKNQFITK